MAAVLTLLPGQQLYASHRADPRALALYKRHYSAERSAPYRLTRSLNFVAAGQPLVLLTVAGDACFVWLRNTAERLDHQAGICCTLFRNEGPLLSSALVREADALAWARWPDVPRHFTYVDPGKVRHKRDPGRCFRRAGWRPCGVSGRGLLLLEVLPEWVPEGPAAASSAAHAVPAPRRAAPVRVPAAAAPAPAAAPRSAVGEPA